MAAWMLAEDVVQLAGRRPGFSPARASRNLVLRTTCPYSALGRGQSDVRAVGYDPDEGRETVKGDLLDVGFSDGGHGGFLLLP